MQPLTPGRRSPSIAPERGPPNFGANFKVNEAISAYANYSTSFKISTQVVSGATSGSLFLPNETAKGVDYGFKGSGWGDKLNWTAGGFYILQENMSVTVDNGLGGTTREASGTVTSRGVALTATYNPTASWGFSGGYYYTDARWGKTGFDLDLSGRRVPIVPDEVYNFTANYRFGRALKGLRTFLLYQRTGETPASERGGVRPTGSTVIPVGSNNGLRKVILPAYETIDAGASYAFATNGFGKRLSHSIQLNVGNVLDEDYITYSRGVGDRRAYKLTYQVSF